MKCTDDKYTIIMGMKYRNIEYTLKNYIPRNIRLQTYKYALNYYLTGRNETLRDWGKGLCLSLPCALWGLYSYTYDVPTHNRSWSYKDTEKAFPEVQETISYLMDRGKRLPSDALLALRIDALKEAVKKLENEIS